MADDPRRGLFETLHNNLARELTGLLYLWQLPNEALQLWGVRIQGGIVTAATGRMRRLIPVIALVGAGVLAITGCSASGGGSASGGAGDGKFSYLGQTENTTIINTLKTLSTGECTAEEKAAPLTADSIAGTQWDQKLQLLAGQNALSNMSMAAGTPDLMKQFVKSGQILDLSDELDKLGVADQILPAAASTIKALYG